MPLHKVIVGVAISKHGDIRPCYGSSEIAMTAYRYWKANNQHGDNTVYEDKREVKVYKNHSDIKVGERLIIFQVILVELKRWADIQEVI